MLGRGDREPELGKGLWTTVRLVFRVAPGRATAVTALMVASGALPVAFTISSGILVGRVPAAVRDGLDGPGGQALQRALAVVAAVFVVQQVVAILVDHLADVLGRHFNGALRDRVVAASLDPVGIAHLEDAQVLDTMGLARNVAPGFLTPGSAVYGLVAGVGGRLEMVVSAVVVATFSVPLGVVLLAVSALAQALLLRSFFRSMRLLMAGTGGTDLRRAVYFRDLALTPGASKELRVFGLGGWVGRRFTAAWLDAIQRSWAQRRSGYGTLIVSAVLFGVTIVVGLGFVIAAAVRGDIDLGRFAVLTGAVLGCTVFSASDHDIRAAYGAAAVPALLALEREVGDARFAPARPAGAGALGPDHPSRDLAFESVSFRYPGSEQHVFRDLDLRLHAGQSLAIVGANGAGKTTLVKLLARLYDPTGGRITVDGIDVASVAPAEWRRHIAVLFQDYVRYALPASDNIGFGAPHRADPDALRHAADRAGALDLVDGLPDGWDTVLSRTLTGGVDLSGGQWQRVALARALLAVAAGARVLVLDEPAANLDVRAEADLYDRFLDLTKGLTSIVISHRFSTVRRADRIVVIEGGQVIEDGTHDELLALGGRYATMFRLQADRFVEATGA